MTMLDTPPPDEQKQERQYLRTNDDQKTDQKPVDSMFESDKDTAAASEQPAKGDTPIPTQEGKRRRISVSRTSGFRLADRGQAFSTDPGEQAAAPQNGAEAGRGQAGRNADADSCSNAGGRPPKPATPPPTPVRRRLRRPKSRAGRQPTPMPAPTPVPAPAPTPQVAPAGSTAHADTRSDAGSRSIRSAVCDAASNVHTDSCSHAEVMPPDERQPTPAPRRSVPSDEELAMLRPTPTPRPTPSRQAQRNPQRPSAPPTAYRQEQRITRMQGNINSRGRSSIAALGTPQGRFEKAVQDAIGSRWYYYVRCARVT